MSETLGICPNCRRAVLKTDNWRYSKSINSYLHAGCTVTHKNIIDPELEEYKREYGINN